MESFYLSQAAMQILKLLFLTIIFSILIFSSSCVKKESYSISENSLKKDSVTYYNLTSVQKKVLEGAKKCLSEKFEYDMEMKYHVLKYKNGVNTGSAVYPEGDLNPLIGVCTDVIIRALRYGGICDLQEKIHEDILSDWNSYPMSRWNSRKTDANIDHRRVPNVMVWLGKYWQNITGNDYLPGDIIVWDMNKDSWGDHIGIISDKTENSVPYLIHNFPSPGYVAEEDVLNRWKIIGHYRVKSE
jgi:uncharacterized protein YijF (DUF1287 family)